MSNRFYRGQIVWVNDLPSNMSHFERNCFAVIEGDYDSLCMGDLEEVENEDNENRKYQLLLLMDIPSILVGSCTRSAAWYPANALTLIDQEKEVGKKILREEALFSKHKGEFKSLVCDQIKQLTKQKEQYNGNERSEGKVSEKESEYTG